MKKMFLASSFKDVAHLLQDFADDDLQGKTVKFIPVQLYQLYRKI